MELHGNSATEVAAATERSKFKGQRNDGIITAKSMLRFYLAFTSGHCQKKDPQLIPQTRDKF